MPLYEYECSACRRRTEKIQRFSDPELTVCPHCGGPLARTLTAPAIQFKGSGWYKDLYSSAKPPAASGEGAPAAASGSGEGPAPGSKSEAPAAKGGTALPSAAATPASPSTPAASSTSSGS